jgi:hypothetical protein
MRVCFGKILMIVGLSIIWIVLPMDSEEYKLMMVVPKVNSLGKMDFGGRAFYGEKSALYKGRGNFSICFCPRQHETLLPVKKYEDFLFCAVCPQDRMFRPVSDHEELETIVKKVWKEDLAIKQYVFLPSVFPTSFLFLAIQKNLNHEALKNKNGNYYLINGRDNQGRTALHWLVRHPDATKEDVDVLLKQGALLLAYTDLEWVPCKNGLRLKPGRDVYYDGIKHLGRTPMPEEQDKPFKPEDQYYGKREVMNYAFSLILCKKIQKLFRDELYEKLQELQKQQLAEMEMKKYTTLSRMYY